MQLIPIIEFFPKKFLAFLQFSEDFLTPWLKFILNFFGIEKVDVVSADQMALDYEKSIKDAEEQIHNLTK